MLLKLHTTWLPLIRKILFSSLGGPGSLTEDHSPDIQLTRRKNRRNSNRTMKHIPSHSRGSAERGAGDGGPMPSLQRSSPALPLERCSRSRGAWELGVNGDGQETGPPKRGALTRSVPASSARAGSRPTPSPVFTYRREGTYKSKRWKRGRWWHRRKRRH